jgi:hypothetical protein
LKVVGNAAAADGIHADIMHAADAAAHEQRRHWNTQQSQPFGADDVQADTG